MNIPASSSPDSRIFRTHRVLAAAICVISIIAGNTMLRAESVEQQIGYEAVQRAFLREDFELVTTFARDFLAGNPISPKVPRVWLWLALSLDRLQHANEALGEIDRLKTRLSSNDPLWPETLYWEGEISRKAFQMVRAKLAYQQLLDRYPTSSWESQAQLGMGLIHLHQQAFEPALGYFHRLAARSPVSPTVLDAMFYEGVCALQLKRHAQAVSMFESLLLRLQESRAASGAAEFPGRQESATSGGGAARPRSGPAVGLDEPSDRIAQVEFYDGESLAGLARYDDAARAYQRAIASAETLQWRQPALFGLGWAYYQADRCEESVNTFEPYLASPVAEHKTEARFAQGTCLLRLGREEAALAQFRHVIADDSRLPAARFAGQAGHPLAVESGLILADADRRHGRLEEARELFFTMLGWPVEPVIRAQLQLRLGHVALEQGNATQATMIFSIVAERADSSARSAALSGLGDVQMFLGNLANANTFYEQAIALTAPTSGAPGASSAESAAAYATYQLGRIRLQQGAVEEAVQTFQGLASGAPTMLADDATLALIIAYVNRHEEEKAQTVLEAIRAGDRGRTRPLAARAAYYDALLALGRGDEANARQWCEEVIAKAPDSDEALEARLLLIELQEHERGTSQDVESELRRLFADPGVPRGYRANVAKRLGDMTRSRRDYAGAIRWYDQALQLLPAMHGEVAYHIASCYEEGGDIDVALRWYQQVDQAPWHVRGQLAAAKLLERQDRSSDAQAVYRQLASEPIPEAKVAQERLTALQAERRSTEIPLRGISQLVIRRSGGHLERNHGCHAVGESPKTQAACP